MAIRLRRLALLAVLCAGTLAVSGCRPVYLVALGKDPAVQHAPPGGRTVADASAGRAFTGRASGNLVSPLKLIHGPVTSKTNWARFQGTFKSSLAGSPLASAYWHARFRGVRNRDTGKFATKGLVLATFEDDPDAGRACLKVTNRGQRRQNRRPRRASLSTVTVLGGEGGARTLYGTASVRVRLARDNSLRLRGRVKQRRGAARGLTPACAKLKRKFDLPPVD